MIGGYDIVFDSHAEPAEVFKKAWLLILSLWPNAVVEDANTGELLPGSFPPGALGDQGSIMVYKDEDARDAWTRLGGEPENLGTMIHVLASPGCATLVVDDPDDPITKKVIQGMDVFFKNKTSAISVLAS